MASARSGFRSRTASSSSRNNQPYMAVHEAIPEEEPPRYRDDKESSSKDNEDMEGLLASSDSDAGEDANAVKMRRRRRSSSGAKAGGGAAGLGAKVKAKTAAAARRRSGSGSGAGGSGSYVPVVRNSGDYETYLDSITEAEQELLSAEHGQEYEDYGERYDVDADDYEQGYGVGDSEFTDDDGLYAGKAKRRRTRGPCGIRGYWYSTAFCRSLLALIVGLVLLVLGFVSLARYRRAAPAYYLFYCMNTDKIKPMVPADHRYPTPRGGTDKSWEESYQRAWDLVRNMTLTEKVNITTGTGWQMGQCVGNTGSASLVGFPSLCLQDGPMGLRFADHITAFPPGLTTGATWNRSLIHERGVALGAEARLKGVNVLLGPSMGSMGMMPAGGRNWEGFGSDPVLQGVASAETIRGIQSNGVMATAKHYVMNEQEHFRQSHEWGIDTALSSNVNDRALHEVFVWPFAESIRADVASVMCAYQMVNNSYSCENSKLLNGVLKDELGFQGFVQSDWLAQRSGVNSAISGLDMSMPGDGLHWADGKALWGSELTRAVLNTSVPMDRLDDMVSRIVAAYYHFQQDEWEEQEPNFSSWTKEESGAAFLYYGSPNDQNYGLLNKFVDAAVGHSDVARRVAAEGIVLLKNEQETLPLTREPDGPYRVGIYGDDAGPANGPNACSDRGCNQGTLASGWGSGTVDFPYLVSPLDALHAAWESREDVEVTDYLRNAVMADDTTDKDLCVVFANADGGEGYIAAGGIHGDRNDLFLQKGGDTLIQTVAPNCGNGKGRTVVVVHSIGPVVVDPWIHLPSVHAVVFANLPGQESGNALVDVLFGDVDASGRLPYTIGHSLEDYGAGAQVLYEPNAPVPQVNFTDGLYMDYRYFDRYNITPQYEFGFGLSYTTFEFSQPHSSSMHWKSRFPDTRPPSGAIPPSYDPTLPEAGSVLFPQDHPRVEKYIYPYLDTLDGTTPAPYDYPKGYNLSEPAPESEAGGGLGGNPSLYQEMVRVQVQVANTGSRTGQEVVQVYVSFPTGVVEEVEQHPQPPGSSPSPTPGADSDPDKAVSSTKKGKGKGKGKGPLYEEIEFPERVLRNFTKIELDPGSKETVELTLTRKDLSYWSVRWQNWVMPEEGKFQIWVGRSSRDLILAGEY